MAECYAIQQTATLPRLYQDAAKFGLGDGPIETPSSARPRRLLRRRVGCILRFTHISDVGLIMTKMR